MTEDREIRRRTFNHMTRIGFMYPFKRSSVPTFIPRAALSQPLAEYQTAPGLLFLSL